MRELHQAHLAHHVVVLVEREAIDADRDGAAARMRGGDRARGRSADAGSNEKLVTRRAPDAAIISSSSGRAWMPWASVSRVRQQADVAEIANDAMREMLVGIGALIDGLQQMHVNAAAGRGRAFGDGFQQRARAPLHAGGAELHVDLRARDGGGDGLGELDVVARRHRRRATNSCSTLLRSSAASADRTGSLSP